MLLKYLRDLENSLTKYEFKVFIQDVENVIKVNRVAFGKRTSQAEFVNICEILKGALVR